MPNGHVKKTAAVKTAAVKTASVKSVTKTSDVTILAKYGYHEYQLGERPKNARLGQHFPCRVCGKSKKFRGHRNVATVQTGTTLKLPCPTCNETGSVTLSVSDIQQLALKRRS